ncbi:MAG: hypothetical protein KatS3mg095_0413 [Candidatus Parcubacteria bacterium]|nr:MAG: hypothetical protein KatS3mg095_0413 [Candidatus Parcubacteria bacterium]
MLFIKGNVDFYNSQIEDLGNLKKIRGWFVNFSNSKIKTLGNLEEIVWDADFYNSQVEDLGNLKRIGGRCIVNRNNKKLINLLKERGITNIVDEEGNKL